MAKVNKTRVPDTKYPKGKNVVTGDYLTLGKDNPHVHGKYMLAKKVTIDPTLGKQMIYQIETDAGLVSVIGSTVLNRKMEKVNTGRIVYITFDGTIPSKKKGRNPTKRFVVSWD